MLYYIMFTSNPSFAFLWSVLSSLFYFSRISKLDRSFGEIVEELEDEMEGSDLVSVAVIQDKAYWVVDNMFYQADVIDGEIDRSSSRPVNAFDMPYKDVTKMLFILDNLTEG